MSGKCIQDLYLECIKKNFRKCLPKFKFRYAIINLPVQISADTGMNSDTDMDTSKSQKLIHSFGPGFEHASRPSLVQYRPSTLGMVPLLRLLR